jgi:hypothetical protein
MLFISIQADSDRAGGWTRSSAFFRAVQHLVCRKIAQNTRSLSTGASARGKIKARAHWNLWDQRPV